MDDIAILVDDEKYLQVILNHMENEMLRYKVKINKKKTKTL